VCSSELRREAEEWLSIERQGHDDQNRQNQEEQHRPGPGRYEPTRRALPGSVMYGMFVHWRVLLALIPGGCFWRRPAGRTSSRAPGSRSEERRVGKECRRVVW